MFQRFYGQVIRWIEKQGYGPRITALLPQENIQWNDNLIWRAYLAAILPEAASSLITLEGDPLRPLVEQLISQSEFATGPQWVGFIQASPLSFLEEPSALELAEQFAALRSKLNGWYQGTLHSRIEAEPKAAFSDLSRELGISDLWKTAEFLSRLGFGYPHSSESARAFGRFSGLEEIHYFDWFDLLETSLDRSRAYRIDRGLALFFGPKNPLHLPQVCAAKPLCPSCFLQADCRFFEQLYGQEGLLPLENQLKLGRADQLGSRELLLYLAGDRWQNKPLQNKWIAHFVKGELDPDLIRPGDDPEEVDLLLFTRALEEAGQRLALSRRKRAGQGVTSSQDIFEQYRFRLGREKQESFHIAILDNRHRPMSLQMISRGLLDQTLVHPREVFAPALQLQAAAVILIHNHPSGDVRPSNQDLSITKRLCEVGKLVGIKVLDHVIISEESYFSFADENLLPSS
ncbi:MAG: JAB domain-containing protein [bacterium]|nr:JAB domain-containing protein [bacterium]